MCDQDLLTTTVVDSLRDGIKLSFFCSTQERNLDKNSKYFTTAWYHWYMNGFFFYNYMIKNLPI
jgi:hypothetical protein